MSQKLITIYNVSSTKNKNHNDITVKVIRVILLNLPYFLAFLS